MNWSPPARPVDYTEQALITAILAGEYPAGSILPGERDLAAQLGVTRPTLREALRRLERDGWLVVQQGKSTVVNDFWRDGGLNVLNGIARYSEVLPPEFIPNLLQVRLDLAPTFTRMAIERAPEAIAHLLVEHKSLDDTSSAYAVFDWQLQRNLTLHCGNPIYALIFNSFTGFYEDMAEQYFDLPQARETSRIYYAALLDTVNRKDAASAEQITRDVMAASIVLWRRSNSTE